MDDPVFDITSLTPTPEFDIWLYAEISGETRFTDDLLATLEPAWNRWKEHLRAARLVRNKGQGSYLVVWLAEPVEAEVDELWEDSPSEGLFLHHLAVTLVMAAARAEVPELEQNKCAPMPRPTGSIQDAFETLGLEWTAEGTVNRKYAVFTPMPYKGGCEICFLEENCPSSRMQKKWSGQGQAGPSR